MQLIAPPPATRRATLSVLALSAAAAAVGWMLWYPLRSASAYLDDYLFLALGVHLRTPAILLFQDSTGSFFFRPLVMYLWALSVAAFGNAAAVHLALNMALHVANGVALYALARAWRISLAPAAMASLVFVAHPAAFSAAAWLSDRFDLFALLFGLGSLLALQRFLRARRSAMLGASAALLLAALMSKEVAFAFVPAACAMALWPVRDAMPAGVARRAAWALVFVACALLALAARSIALRDVAEPMFLHHGLLSMTFGGIAHWSRRIPVAIFGTHDASLLAVLAQWPLLILAVAGVLSRRVWTELESSGLIRCVVVGIALVAACAVVQAPVMNFFPMDAPDRSSFSFNALAGSRFYYIPLAGLSLIAAAIGQAALATHASERVRLGVLAAALLAGCGMLAASRSVGREWAAFTERNALWVRAAVSAVETVRATPHGCKIYLLGTPASAAGFRVLADTAVKQALPVGDPRMRCFIQSEHTPWYNLVESTPSVEAGPAPLQEMTLAGKPYPPLRVANLTYFYLNAGDTERILLDPRATFFLWEGASFVDVTPLARSGALNVRFYDNRPTY